MWGVLGASRYAYDHQNTACRIETCLKRRHYAIPVSSFIVWTRVAVSLCAALPRETKIMVAELTGQAAINVHASYERKWACCKHARFQTNGPWCGYTVFAGLTSQYLLSGLSHGRALRCYMSIIMTLSNPLIPYSHYHGPHLHLHLWTPIDGCLSVWRAVSRNDNPHSR